MNTVRVISVSSQAAQLSNYRKTTHKPMIMMMLPATSVNLSQPAAYLVHPVVHTFYKMSEVSQVQQVPLPIKDKHGLQVYQKH